MAAKANQAPVLIKKIKKGDHAGHHGGAWKVAYADFVTAMMAFFLLMWLINTTTPEQKTRHRRLFRARQRLANQ
jgi:chemotaxis protein MotB